MQHWFEENMATVGLIAALAAGMVGFASTAQAQEAEKVREEGVEAMDEAAENVTDDEEEKDEQTAEASEKDEMDRPKKRRMVTKMQKKTAADGYLKAHRDQKNPRELLGGPIEVTIKQESGGVKVALPSKRRLDPNVFGTPNNPRQYDGTPAMTGVPMAMRGAQQGQYTEFQQRSPFGNKSTTMGKGKLEVTAVDKTATDTASGTSGDKVEFSASWQDGEENTYSVKCCETLATAGLEYPTFGGVVSNHLMHGWTGIGTPLMPTTFSYVAFWGMGQVMKNGEVVDDERLVHGMLTEYVRKENYELAFDHEITPSRVHFHLMVAPFAADKKSDKYKKSPVATGFEMENGEELPFWHVMFNNLDINASRMAATEPATDPDGDDNPTKSAKAAD